MPVQILKLTRHVADVGRVIEPATITACVPQVAEIRYDILTLSVSRKRDPQGVVIGQYLHLHPG